LIRRAGSDFTRAARPRQDALSRADVQHRFNSVYAIASSRTGVVLRHIVTAWILPRVIGGLGSPLVLLPQPGDDRARGMSRAPRCRPEPGGLYKALSPTGNPTLFTLLGATKALIRLEASVIPAD